MLFRSTLDENEKPKTEVETQGKYTEIHREYVNGNENPRETKRFENKGLDTQKEYTYEYSEDGTEVKESISELGGTKNTVTIKKDDVLPFSYRLPLFVSILYVHKIYRIYRTPHYIRLFLYLQDKALY